jgi:CHAD domain-containing protein
LASRIKGGEPIPRAIARVARRQLSAAFKGLTDPQRSLSDRIHDLRTATKKVRALVRLVRPSVGGPARRENRRLRKIARSISGLRDAEVLLSTFDRLTEPQGSRQSASLSAARAALEARLRERAQPFERGPQIERLGARVRRARRRVARWTPAGDRWRTIGPGLTESYRRARDAMARAYRRGGADGAASAGGPVAADANQGDRNQSGADFHAWRRAVKTHRHQIRLLEALCPRELAPRLEQLDQLGEWLGEEHDLTVLEQALRSNDISLPDGRGRQRLLARLGDQRRGLRARARPLGEQLFSQGPQVFNRRIHGLFRAFRRAS